MRLFDALKKNKNKIDVQKAQRYFEEKEKTADIIKAQKDEGNYESAYKIAKEIFLSGQFEEYHFQTKIDVCKLLIEVCLFLGKDNEADEYVNKYITIDDGLKTVCGSFQYTIGMIMLEHGRQEKAEELLRECYFLSDGAFFYDEKGKALLKMIGIEDDRTFEDYSNEY